MAEEVDVATVQAELSEIKTTLTGVVEELKISRKEKADAEAKALAAETKLKEKEEPKGNEGTPNVTEEVQKALAKEKGEAATRNRERAIAAFKEKHKEFHPDNDAGGIKFSALESKLSRFSTAGLTEESDFSAILDDAYVLLNPTKVGSDSKVIIPGASTSSQSGSPKESDTTGQLSSKEATVIERLGWTKEKFLDQKAKRPSYIASLLNYMD